MAAPDAVATLARGGAIPAHPLALHQDRTLDTRRQAALTRYYLEAGAAGLAVAVHTTQFALHEPGRGLLRPVLELAATTAAEYTDSSPLLISGVVGPTGSAVAGARLAAELGYDFILLTPYGTGDTAEDALIDRARAVGEVLPVIGFYLQPAVGGRRLGRTFWRRLAELPSVAGIKVAPFDRYATLEVMRGVAESGRSGEIALYTGNDDHIITDLVSRFHLDGPDGRPTTQRMVGGLLGQWAVWVRKAVEITEAARRAQDGDDAALRLLTGLNPALTDANAAILDAAHDFRGCVPGIHEVLRRQGLLAGIWCLDDDETLSPGQAAEIDRVWAAYPHLRDDDFVAENLDRWLS